MVRCESDDFLHWSSPEEVYRGTSHEDQIYSMPVFYREGLYFGAASVFHEGDRSLEDFDTVDIELTCSKDGIHWSRPTFKRPFIPRGKGKYGDGVADSGCIYSSAPITVGDEYRFYYFGSNGTHTQFREASLMYASVPVEKIIGFKPYSDADEGYILTNPIEFTGNSLFATADVESEGCISVSICKDPESYHEEPIHIDGFSKDDCIATKEGCDRWSFSFTGGKLTEASARAGGATVLCFHLKRAELYSFDGDFRPPQK